MQAKLNPRTPATASSTSLVGKLSFPGFQEILDFTATGSESSKSVTVDGDTDKEYRIFIRNLSGTDMYVRLNNDSTANKYGIQRFYNSSGTIGGNRDTYHEITYTASGFSLMDISLITPVGFIKTGMISAVCYGSGTTIYLPWVQGFSYNSTSNVTSIDFIMSSGNFTSGSRITVYARRSN